MPNSRRRRGRKRNWTTTPVSNTRIPRKSDTSTDGANTKTTGGSSTIAAGTATRSGPRPHTRMPNVPGSPSSAPEPAFSYSLGSTRAERVARYNAVRAKTIAAVEEAKAQRRQAQWVAKASGNSHGDLAPVPVYREPQLVSVPSASPPPSSSSRASPSPTSTASESSPPLQSARRHTSNPSLAPSNSSSFQPAVEDEDPSPEFERLRLCVPAKTPASISASAPAFDPDFTTSPTETETYGLPSPSPLQPLLVTPSSSLPVLDQGTRDYLPEVEGQDEGGGGGAEIEMEDDVKDVSMPMPISRDRSFADATTDSPFSLRLNTQSLSSFRFTPHPSKAKEISGLNLPPLRKRKSTHARVRTIFQVKHTGSCIFRKTYSKHHQLMFVRAVHNAQGGFVGWAVGGGRYGYGQGHNKSTARALLDFDQITLPPRPTRAATATPQPDSGLEMDLEPNQFVNDAVDLVFGRMGQDFGHKYIWGSDDHDRASPRRPLTPRQAAAAAAYLDITSDEQQLAIVPLCPEPIRSEPTDLALIHAINAVSPRHLRGLDGFHFTSFYDLFKSPRPNQNFEMNATLLVQMDMDQDLNEFFRKFDNPTRATAVAAANARTEVVRLYELEAQNGGGTSSSRTYAELTPIPHPMLHPSPAQWQNNSAISEQEDLYTFVLPMPTGAPAAPPIRHAHAAVQYSPADLVMIRSQRQGEGSVSVLLDFLLRCLKWFVAALMQFEESLDFSGVKLLVPLLVLQASFLVWAWTAGLSCLLLASYSEL